MSESTKIWHTYDSTSEEDENIKLSLPLQRVRFQTPFLLFLKCSFNYLTGEQFQPIAVKSCSESANVYQSHCGPNGE